MQTVELFGGLCISEEKYARHAGCPNCAFGIRHDSHDLCRSGAAILFVTPDAMAELAPSSSVDLRGWSWLAVGLNAWRRTMIGV